LEVTGDEEEDSFGLVPEGGEGIVVEENFGRVGILRTVFEIGAVEAVVDPNFALEVVGNGGTVSDVAVENNLVVVV